MADQGFDSEFPFGSDFPALDAEESAPGFSIPREDETPSLAVNEEGELAALRRELAEAKPRLEAFAQLEEIADAQGTTPEAIAIQASIELLVAEETEKRSELERLQAEIATAERDHLAVLDEHSATVDQMAEMIDELESIRADAVRLLGEKASLEMKVEALRNESDSMAQHGERRAEPRAIESDEDEAVAFDRFFEAEVVEDKARAWMLEER